MDIKISTSGDLLFEYQESPQQFNLSFNYRDKSDKSFRLQFSYVNDIITPMPVQALSFSFNYAKDKNTYKLITLHGNSELAQSISNIIRTAIGEIKHDSDYGSSIELFMHSNLRDSSILNGIKNAVYEAVSKILESPKVVIEPKVELNFAGYYQGVYVKVYDYDELVGAYNLV